MRESTKDIIMFILVIVFISLATYIIIDSPSELVDKTLPENILPMNETSGIQIEQLYRTLPADVLINVNASEVVLEHITRDDLQRSINGYVLVENTTTAGSIIFNNTLYVTVTAQNIETGEVYAKTEMRLIK